MRSDDFWVSAHALGEAILRFYGQTTPWQHRNASEHFWSEMDRIWAQLHDLSSEGREAKLYFCLEMARLVWEVLLPDLKDRDGDCAFKAVNDIFTHVHLVLHPGLSSLEVQGKLYKQLGSHWGQAALEGLMMNCWFCSKDLHVPVLPSQGRSRLEPVHS